MKLKLDTIIYINGEDYLGTYTERSLDHWKQTGYIRDFKYMYKGYRYSDGKRNTVIVYTNKEWSKIEKAKRYNNGFLGIKQYICHS